MARTQDITGGLPRVTEIFEARKPQGPGRHGGDLRQGGAPYSDKRRGKMTIVSAATAAMEFDHHVPQDKHLLVHAGDYVEAGDPLIEGPLMPH
jgi:DNA-directed RNA polymerase subunit beta'